MNHIQALGSALYSRLNTQGTISIYYQLAPQNTSPPYAIFQPQSPGVDEYAFGSTESNLVSCVYTLKVVDDSTWPSNGWSLYQHLDTAIQGFEISVSGYDTLRVQRESSIEFRDQEDNWHCGGLFRIDLHKQ